MTMPIPQSTPAPGSPISTNIASFMYRPDAGRKGAEANRREDEGRRQFFHHTEEHHRHPADDSSADQRHGNTPGDLPGAQTQTACGFFITGVDLRQGAAGRSHTERQEAYGISQNEQRHGLIHRR